MGVNKNDVYAIFMVLTHAERNAEREWIELVPNSVFLGYEIEQIGRMQPLHFTGT